MNFFSSIFFKFILFFPLVIFLFGCQEDNKPKIVLSFDTEYPVGIGFPENFTEEQKNEFIPRENEWIQGIREINEIGRKNKVKFQFNVVGITAERYPEIIKELSRDHDISCHSYSHKDQLKIDYTEKIEELEKCKEVVERIIGKEIKGNRFPYTRHDNESFTVLKETGYKWDSSVWKDKNELVPFELDGIMGYPINPASEDWYYFIKQQNRDIKGFFRLFDEEIGSLDKESVYVIILHPWVLVKDKEKIKALEGFVLRHKENIRSIDEIHSESK